MKQIAIIGAGISGLSSAQLLTEFRNDPNSPKRDFEITIYEKEAKPGGLICCERINGSLFHTCGGHVFNTRNQEVNDWFWRHFDKDKEFLKTDRNSVIFLPNGQHIPYPIENFIYLLDNQTQKNIIHDLLCLRDSNSIPADNFQDFLKNMFGDTLYQLYFKPYNTKVWRRSLHDMPIDWLSGKLPMSSIEEIIYNNFNRVAEKQFVHSTFYYERQNGSQLIADRLSEGLKIKYNTCIEQINRVSDKWEIDGILYDIVIFCGNIKDLPGILQEGPSIERFYEGINALQYHGTTATFCEIDSNPYSWIYLPSTRYQAHRIICTGNFSQTNNSVALQSLDQQTVNLNGRITATIEFTDIISKSDILENLKSIPLHPRYITHKYNKYTYPIQSKGTREMISTLKQQLATKSFYLTGRFADWEYYNMDAAIAAAMKTIKNVLA